MVSWTQDMHRGRPQTQPSGDPAHFHMNPLRLGTSPAAAFWLSRQHLSPSPTDPAPECSLPVSEGQLLAASATILHFTSQGQSFPQSPLSPGTCLHQRETRGSHSGTSRNVRGTLEEGAGPGRRRPGSWAVPGPTPGPHLPQGRPCALQATHTHQAVALRPHRTATECWGRDCRRQVSHRPRPVPSPPARLGKGLCWLTAGGHCRGE